MQADDNSPTPDTPGASTQATPGEFRSPKRCLARSFQKSRDGWKRKATERRNQIKSLLIKVRDLELSRDLWKDRVRQLQSQLALLLPKPPPAEFASEPSLPEPSLPESSLPETPLPEPSLPETPLPETPGNVCDLAVPAAPVDSLPLPLALPDTPEVPSPKKARRARR